MSIFNKKHEFPLGFSIREDKRKKERLNKKEVYDIILERELAMFIFDIAKWILTILMKLLVFGIASLTALFGAIYYIDNFTRPEYGEVNLYIIAGAFSFFPVFFGLFFVFLWGKLAKENKKNKGYNKEYLKEGVLQKGIKTNGA